MGIKSRRHGALDETLNVASSRYATLKPAGLFPYRPTASQIFIAVLRASRIGSFPGLQTILQRPRGNRNDDGVDAAE